MTNNTQNKKYNKGEWSEAYVILKLLSEGNLFAADEKLNKLPHIFYPIIKILREETESLAYHPGTKVRVVNANTSSVISDITIDKLRDIVVRFGEGIRKGKGRTFALPEFEHFLSDFGISNLKAKSADKRDITIVVHDAITNTEPTLGFSIKSMLGSAGTLFNSAAACNFLYEITGDMLSSEKIEQINSLKGIRKVVRYLKGKNHTLKFIDVEGDIFKSNLLMIDSNLPEILAEMVLYYFSGEASRTVDLLRLLNRKNPCNFNTKHNHPFYEYKYKNFLTDVALGMTSSRVWDGTYDATGGSIIVKNDGEVVCYHIYNRREFQDYLIKNTKLDTPSTTKFDFGKIFESEDKLYIKLNLQVRFV